MIQADYNSGTPSPTAYSREFNVRWGHFYFLLLGITWSCLSTYQHICNSSGTCMSSLGHGAVQNAD